MDAQLLATAFRGGERLGIVAVAALCIWLGYRLFQSLPAEHSAGGTLTLPSAKLVMSKVGPGVFFALFGALVLWQSVKTQMTAGPVAATATATQTASLAEGRQITFGASGGDPEASSHVQEDIAVLNCLAGFAPDGLGPGAAERALHKARVALLAAVWQPGWGDTAFAALERGEIPASGPVADLYRAQNHACPPAGGPKR
ncbi:MAG TPA: hypothetical protein VLX44_18475 [Xanthobacteraceae bacterium]|nr:hypothetical protein [Xanthobacteraceae bacterium]